MILKGHSFKLCSSQLIRTAQEIISLKCFRLQDNLLLVLHIEHLNANNDDYSTLLSEIYWNKLTISEVRVILIVHLL